MSVLQFENAKQTWWNGKLFVRYVKQAMTGELAALAKRCGKSAGGA